MPPIFTSRVGVGLLLTALACDCRATHAEIVFESATGAPTLSGVLIADDAWFFHSFEITAPTDVAKVGVFVQAFDPGQVFAAMVALSSEFDLPDSIDLSTPDLLGTAVIDVPDTGIDGSEVSGALPLSLAPGWYALGFGTGKFGAAPGPASDIAVESLTTDLAPGIFPYSQFQADHPFVPNSTVFQAATPRFFVETATLTADFDGSGKVDGDDLQQWETAFGANNLADADGDGDSDGADFMQWQREFLPPPLSLLTNGDFETGSLPPWTPVVTPNGDVSLGFPRVEAFDVDGNGEASDAMRIRVGQQVFDFQNPAGGGIEQTFTVDSAGTFSVTADIASTNIDISGNSGPGRFELLVDGSLLDVVDMNGTVINPGDVLRDTLSATAVGLSPGAHTLQILVLRTAVNSREIYQYVDNVSVVQIGTVSPVHAVPEPSAVALIGIGLSASIWRLTLRPTRNATVRERHRRSSSPSPPPGPGF